MKWSQRLGEISRKYAIQVYTCWKCAWLQLKLFLTTIKCCMFCLYTLPKVEFDLWASNNCRLFLSSQTLLSKNYAVFATVNERNWHTSAWLHSTHTCTHTTIYIYIDVFRTTLYKVNASTNIAKSLKASWLAMHSQVNVCQHLPYFSLISIQFISTVIWA